MALNSFNGWMISTALLWLFRDNTTSTDTASLLSANNTTKMGSTIPVVLGRGIIKEPLTSYYGDYSSSPYTETYAAHSQFDAKSLILYMITTYIGLVSNQHVIQTTVTQTGEISAPVTTSGGSGSANVAGITSTLDSPLVKDDTTGQLLNALWIWLLGWLINGRMLKTTIQKGFKYYLGWQSLICWSGNEIGIRKVWMNVYDSNIEESSQAAVWINGTASLANNPTGIHVDIDNENMFGGCDEGGGFVGSLHVYFGGDAQSVDPWMVNQMSLDTVEADLKGLTPRYGEFMTVVVPKAYVGKQASIPSIWYEIVNYPNNLGFSQIGNDINPAEAIYEIITNINWGCCCSPDRIDLDSLRALGTVCNTEELGISVVIDSTTTAKDVLNKILAHINAVKFDSPTTGKLTFKMIRSDYDINDLTVFDTSNCASMEFTRLDWSQTSSTISVSFTNAEDNYENGTVPYSDIANRLITGSYATKTVDGSYFTTSVNAKAYAMAESLSAAYPLSSATIETNRIGYNKTIGDPILVRWSPYGISKMVMRITDIDYGSLTSSKIKITTLEDVFGFSKTEYTYGSGSEWTTPDYLPETVAYKKYMEAPYEFSRVKDTYLYAMAVQPSVHTVYWNTWRYVNQTYQITAKSSLWTTAARMVYGYSKEFADDSIGFEVKAVGVSNDFTNMIANISSSPTLFNNTSGTNILVVDDEIMSYNTIVLLPNGDYQIKGILRGIYDTLPGIHTSESIVYFMNTMINVNGGTSLVPQGSISSEQLGITTETLDKSAELDYNSIIDLNTVRRAEQPSIMNNLKMGAYRSSKTVYEYDTTVALSGDISFTLNQRDKFKLNGIISQLDTSYRGQALTASDTMKNVIRVTYSGFAQEFMYDALDISQFKFTWAEFCRYFHAVDSNAIGLDILTYDTSNQLYSYSVYKNSVSYNCPTIVGIVATDADVQAYANSLVQSTTVVIPSSGYIPQTVLTYNDCPLILVTNLVSSSGVMGQDGINYSITADMYRIDGIDTYGNAIIHNEELIDNYVFKSNFNVAINNYSLFYKIENSIAKPYTI